MRGIRLKQHVKCSTTVFVDDMNLIVQRVRISELNESLAYEKR